MIFCGHRRIAGRGARQGVFFIGLLAVLVVVSSPSLAQPPRRADTRAARQEIQDAERARAAELKAQREATARAEKAVATERRLVGDRAAALSRLRATEQTTAAIAARVEALVAQESTAEQNILARAEDLAVLMPLLHRLSRYPAETMLAVQPNQDRALRGVLVLRGLATQMERDAKALRAEQAGLARTQENLGTEQLRLGAALAAQAAAGAVLDRQIGAVQGTRRAQEGLAEDAARKAAQQAERASSLRAVITEIEAQRRASEEQARAEADRATRERRTGAAAAARRREAALARPSGAGTIAANAPPTWPASGPGWWRPRARVRRGHRGRPRHGPHLPSGAGRANRFPLRRTGGVCRAVSQFWPIVDCRLRSPISRRAGGNGTS